MENLPASHPQSAPETRQFGQEVVKLVWSRPPVRWVGFLITKFTDFLTNINIGDPELGLAPAQYKKGPAGMHKHDAHMMRRIPLNGAMTPAFTSVKVHTPCLVNDSVDRLC